MKNWYNLGGGNYYKISIHALIDNKNIRYMLVTSSATNSQFHASRNDDIINKNIYILRDF